jgi:hypothetical protein
VGRVETRSDAVERRGGEQGCGREERGEEEGRRRLQDRGEEKERRMWLIYF